MKALLSDDLWQELSKHSPGHRRLCTAVAHVTKAHLEFREGDLLVCDASDHAIKAGLTSAAVLRTFVDRGAQVYSYQGLHAKVVVIDDKALIGSANFSANACLATCEAALLTDDPQVTALVQAFVDKVKDEADEVNSDFLKRIESLPVTRGRAWGRTRKRKIAVGESRVWFISTGPLSDEELKTEEQFIQAGRKEAERHRTSPYSDVEPIRWAGKSRFRSQAKPGDLILQAYIERRGKRIEVYGPAPIRHRQDEERWTRFYVEVLRPTVCYPWKDVKSDFRSLGIRNITPHSTRELRGKALGILHLLE
jgi:hypothetical protein